MKTSIKTFAIALSVIVLSGTVSSSFAADPKKAKAAKVRTVSAPSGVKKVVASGNVELILVQDGAESVQMLNDYPTASVTQRGDVLRISADGRETQKVRVSVKDLYRIEASGDVKVSTGSALDLKYLQIILKDNAEAVIGAKVEGLYTLLQDRSNLTLSGSADEHSLQMGKVSSLTMDNFTSRQSSVNPQGAEQIASR
ncbi:GIN domain-containing protein [Pedobacter sp. SYP-B3415]|uniref:GIN domain-containing protein n=1 Tax=Pedobacter sp. SYP-B3415 TaxID=2496641 RepID=UPI00101B74DE|nr:DUF2807 domain-containing protein [Pedobacter sp. SYP-B3415]